MKISRSTHVVEQKCLGIMKGYVKMPTRDTKSVSLGVSTNEQKRFGQSRKAPASGSAPCWGSVPQSG